MKRQCLSPALLLTGSSVDVASILLTAGDLPAWTGTRSKMPMLPGSNHLSVMSQAPGLPTAASAGENHTAKPTLPGSLCSAAPAQGSQTRLCSCSEKKGWQPCSAWASNPPCAGILLLPQRGPLSDPWLFSTSQKRWYFPGQKAGHQRPWDFSTDVCEYAFESHNLLSTIINYLWPLYKPFTISRNPWSYLQIYAARGEIALAVMRRRKKKSEVLPRTW